VNIPYVREKSENMAVLYTAESRSRYTRIRKKLKTKAS